MINLYHTDDERGDHYWPFVYLHGKAEDDNYAVFQQGGSAPDLFVSDTEMPAVPQGETVELECKINGKPGIVVLGYQWAGAVLGGRAAYADDTNAVEHCRKVEDWR